MVAIRTPVPPPPGHRYQSIGHGYAATRREDPTLRAAIHAALGDARSVVNVGAGAGSYEPRDRHVAAVEPSDVMAAQRPRDRAPAIRATADALPFRDDAFDAAMAILTVHHWDDARETGVREMRRVARDRVVIVTFDAEVAAGMWLMRDYLPEVSALDRRIMPPLDQLASWLGGDVEVVPLPIPRDCIDWMLGAFWAHPERMLDEGARAATSGLARMPGEVIDRAVAAVARDLASGAWEARNGSLRELDAFDAGLRVVVAR